ncbi:hypothetical protein CWI42_020980 [Ordospora colligata]|uniref:Uncharacterized protein n=1 Tax=Ordospora colligata OC4 TaxID=1354746 RepID=A0A0B2UML0_9MICR|nr:uncharacterized protein M896_020990 [Ordospora colligata OC4]KHN70262.1 hypothetical protein M896_020990 [Ordospora colligata OC4]TBU19355.1 hypothetical protein CWI42_020980 [Ordospora colligata]
MFVLYLAFATCMSLKKALFEDGDLQSAIDVCETRLDPFDHFYSYFVKKVFMGKADEALTAYVLSSGDDLRNIVLGSVAMNSGSVNKDLKLAADLLWSESSKVSMKYLHNPHEFSVMDRFESLEKTLLPSRAIENIITMVYSGDEGSGQLFLSLLDRKQLFLKDHTRVVMHLAQKGHARALGYLGEMHYYGIGVEMSLEKAMFFYSKAKEMNDAIGMCGVGKVLLSSEYMDKKNARHTLARASRFLRSGEIEYLLYLLNLSRQSLNADMHMENALRQGYLPAIHMDGMKYYLRGEYAGACARYQAVLEYSDVMVELRSMAQKNFVEGKYRQSVIALLMCAELGSMHCMQNAVYLLERHWLFDNQHEILLWLYMQLLQRGDYEVVNRIGNAYFYGRGVAKSYKDALAYYMSAALMNSAEGHYNVGYMYEHGYGVEKSVVSALRHIMRIQSTDEVYLLLFYTYLRLGMKLIVGSVLNKYVVGLYVGWMGIRKMCKIGMKRELNVNARDKNN